MARPDYNAQEKKEAKRDGAVLVKNSGRGYEKGDAKLDVGEWRFLLDYKHYEKTFSCSRTAWAKLRNDAWNSDHRSPLIKVQYGDGIELAIVEWDVFTQLLDDALRWKESEEVKWE